MEYWRDFRRLRLKFQSETLLKGYPTQRLEKIKCRSVLDKREFSYIIYEFKFVYYQEDKGRHQYRLT